MRSIEEIKDEVCFNNGFINYDTFLGTINNHWAPLNEINKVIDSIAKEYAKDNEKYFECDKCDDCLDEHDVVTCPECNIHFQIYEGL